MSRIERILDWLVDNLCTDYCRQCQRKLKFSEIRKHPSYDTVECPECHADSLQRHKKRFDYSWDALDPYEWGDK